MLKHAYAMRQELLLSSCRDAPRRLVYVLFSPASMPSTSHLLFALRFSVYFSLRYRRA